MSMYFSASAERILAYILIICNHKLRLNDLLHPIIGFCARCCNSWAGNLAALALNMEGGGVVGAGPSPVKLFVQVVEVFNAPLRTGRIVRPVLFREVDHVADFGIGTSGEVVMEFDRFQKHRAEYLQSAVPERYPKSARRD